MTETAPLNMFWFLPTSGDGRYLGGNTARRVADNRYMREIAQGVDRLGFQGVLLPTGTGCEDAWITAASVVTHTERLKYLVALRPGTTLPGEAARQASAFDRLSGGRLLLNVVCGGNPADLAGDGIHLGHDERYDQADEFLQVFRGVMAGESVTFSGKYLSVTGGKLLFPPVQSPYPPLYFGGSSPRAMELAADQLDMYLTWGEPPAAVGEKIETMRRLAAARGRTMRFGIRLHLIVRETDEEAWRAADRLISKLSDETIAKTQKFMAEATDSEGQRRMMALHNGRRDALEVSPNLWAGVGLMRGGAGTALVGSPETVATRLREYQALGIDTVIGSGYPHLEEAYRVAELLFPALGLTNVMEHGEGDASRVFGGGGAHDQALLATREAAGAKPGAAAPATPSTPAAAGASRAA